MTTEQERPTHPDLAPHWDRINQGAINEAATKAVALLVNQGAFVARFEPGDATLYSIMVVDARRLGVYTPSSSPAEQFMLSTPFGGVYPWGGQQLEASYCAQKWGRDNLHTGQIVADFIWHLRAAK